VERGGQGKGGEKAKARKREGRGLVPDVK